MAARSKRRGKSSSTVWAGSRSGVRPSPMRLPISLPTWPRIAPPRSTAPSSSSTAAPFGPCEVIAPTFRDSNLELLNPRRHKQRPAKRPAEEGDERQGYFLLCAGSHRHRCVRGVVLDLRRQRPHENQAAILLEQDLGDRAEADLLALALEHMVHHFGAGRVSHDLVLDLTVDAPFFHKPF